jgi:hypothetical protein
MTLQEIAQKMGLYSIVPQFEQTDFVVGSDSFTDVVISPIPSANNVWYFKNQKKGVIHHFVLSRTHLVEKRCAVTLVKNKEGKFTPRFDFQIWDLSKKAYSNFSSNPGVERLIKSKVDLDSCHEAFSLLLGFISSCVDIDFSSKTYAVVDRKKKDIFENLTKELAIKEFTSKYGKEISESDISLLQNRREVLDHFRKLLEDDSFFASEMLRLGMGKKEALWQNFFEANQWIFGYGLQLVACESLEGKKLEVTVAGNDIFGGVGKRIDALLKTKGKISKYLFCEIKTHESGLLIEPYDRPGVFVPGKELRGAVAQVQKTIHKVTLDLRASIHRPEDKNGDPTGEEVLFVKPRGIVVIGKLSDFISELGINQEKLASFELYRQQVTGIEIITYDELYERVKYIIEK